ncbi:hypothetical protein OOK41_09000 [Micromonospora sp. NBC_01655]|uniref:hypothetical protein n=1 Tax=Micromonospora sp. NBC_01655 TaxID=2975983 RepID=UPI0022552B6F|nr:hypothetical protein [Micromonospora sp. NBC_01655]MCX4470442.1 hypothetical protein [Micromonospora sp. NBC_01655]
MQFVDSIAASPTVRLDLQGPGWTVRDGTTFGMPELKRAVAGTTLLGDGESYPAVAYGNRTITLVLRIDGVSDDARAGMLQQLMRELDRPANILRYRPGTSSPVFFRTFRAGPDNVNWDPFTKEPRVTIPAEPFAYGLKETLSPVTVSNNPASTGGCYLDITGVKGDVETPLYLRLGADFMAVAAATRYPVLGLRRRGTPGAAPLVLQAESMVTATATALAASNDTAMSGSGQNYVRITPLNTDMDQRIYADPFPAAASVDVRGRYRVLARVRQSQVLDTWNVQFVYGPLGTLQVSNDAVPVTQAPGPRYVDLGTIQYPYGADPVTDGVSGVEVPVQGIRVSVFAQRVSGTGTLDIDLLMFVPADDAYAAVRVSSDSGAAAGAIDAARTMVYAVGASGEIRPPQAPSQVAGRFPMLSPGVTNRVVWLADGAALADAALTSTSTLTPYYWPRYGYVRPPSS